MFIKTNFLTLNTNVIPRSKFEENDAYEFIKNKRCIRKHVKYKSMKSKESVYELENENQQINYR